LITYYLDGAHTVESIEQFIDWFLEIKKKEKTIDLTEKNVLMFNYTGERDSAKFLNLLMVNFIKFYLKF
jgi:folylpolyglutamate synthase/dihydropteroate synthase